MMERIEGQGTLRRGQLQDLGLILSTMAGPESSKAGRDIILFRLFKGLLED